MPWKEASIMDQRAEFCQLASRPGSNVRELCRRFGISPTTGYTWMRRYQTQGRRGLADHSRRPRSSPWQTAGATETAVCTVHRQYPAWGGKKLAAHLRKLDQIHPVPSPSTITRILHRHGLIAPASKAQHRPCTRFCAPYPNDLWQMDFKGHFPLAPTGRCHPLTVIDDHSRFNLGLRALATEQRSVVQAELTLLFRRYGLPNRILCDNSPPWGTAYLQRWTTLGVWLLRLDIPVSHGRPWHPQTQGKDERFHRTLTTELLSTRSFASLDEVQQAFDDWRVIYNQIRPHEALALTPPMEHYHPSVRSYPEQLPAIEYAAGEVVRRVTTRGAIKLDGARYAIGEAFTGLPLAIRPTADEGICDVYFRHYVIAQIDRRQPTES